MYYYSPLLGGCYVYQVALKGYRAITGVKVAISGVKSAITGVRVSISERYREIPPCFPLHTLLLVKPPKNRL